MLKLDVEIEPNSGFCFGVKNAIKKAEEVLDSGEELFCLGEIVHNEQEIQRLVGRGMKIISQSEFRELKNKTVLFRAHGEPPASYLLAAENGIKVIDASCPIILKLQEKIFRSYLNKEIIYIFGLPNHPEIIGLNGKIKSSAVVFDKYEDLDLEKIPPQITLYSQTTKSLKQFYEVITRLRDAGIEVKVEDSICRQVSSREQELREFCRCFNRIIFVAGTNSSNGKQLYEICAQENANIHFISAVNEIKTTWFCENEKVGICGATSTPLWLIQNVKDYLLRL
ncbi:MAG TPA: 4-hydroxy-3-methylbut-2-enyl diphosphate reductase [Bacteroidales bacterium]|nr:4-hydroxy-3-methylbut-2-enyl diphosphate reductase [Bacteroidales bacterium]